MLCPYRAVEERVPGRGNHHGIQDVVGEPVTRDGRRRRFDDLSGAEHPALDRIGREVGGERVELLRDELGGERLPRVHTGGVLRGDRGDHARAEDTELMERLEVGLNPGAAARIGAGDGQRDSHRVTSLANATGRAMLRGTPTRRRGGARIASNLQTTVRDLQRRKARGRRGLAVLEGVRLVEEALAAGLEFEGALVSPDLARTTRGQTLVADLASHAIAVVAPRIWTVADVSPAPGGAVLVVDGVQDPGNLGTLIRTAHALGAAATVVLRGTADPLNAKALRAAMGATFRHPVVPLDDAAFIAWAQRRGLTLWAAAVDGVPLARALDASNNREELIAVIVGNEGAGIRPQLNAVAAQRVAIPLARGAESLNVAVAAGILLYEVLRGR